MTATPDSAGVITPVLPLRQSPRLVLLSSSHRQFGSLRADTGDAERVPSRERVVAPAKRR